MLKLIMSLVAVVMVATATGAAQGTEVAGEFRQRVVNYSDLNLSNKIGAVALYQRINHAAHLVCDLPIPWDVDTAARVRNCLRAARARSVSEVNAPELTRYYESLHGAPTVVAMSSREP